jgi:hypothetical protein
MPATTETEGAGYYDQHSGAQHASIQALHDWVEDAVAKLPLPASASCSRLMHGLEAPLRSGVWRLPRPGCNGSGPLKRRQKPIAPPERK